MSLTDFSAFLKRLYPNKTPENVASRNRVWLSMVPKAEDFYGYESGGTLAIPLQYSNPGGRSKTPANVYTALGDQITAGKYARFLLTRGADYAAVQIGAEVLHASKRDSGAFAAARKQEVDGMLDELGRSLSLSLYGDGNNVAGQRSSASTNVITLSDADTAKNFRVGMTVSAGPNANGSSLRTGTTTVANVDEDGGTITLTSAAAITSFADNDYLFETGDAAVSSTSVIGLAGWLPLTAPSGGDSFFGLDRSVDTTRLAGVRVNNTSQSIEDNIMQVAERIHRVSNTLPDIVLINPVNFTTLSKSYSAKIEFEGGGGSATVGFETIKVATSAGIVRVYPDPDCPANRGYVLSKKTWKFHHMLGVPHIVEDDGLMAVRIDGKDAVMVRGRLYGNLACDNPPANGVFAI
jgi:hypothetical protein